MTLSLDITRLSSTGPSPRGDHPSLRGGLRRARVPTVTPRAHGFSDRFESSESAIIEYDEYYVGDCLPHERDATVRDLSWAELARIKEFQAESPGTFNAYMKELVGLVPDLGGRLRCLRLEVLQGIWRDEAIPVKLIELKLQFNEVDVSRLVARRPSILITENFEAVPAATAYLQQFVRPSELNHLVESQPWFLAARLEEYLAGYSMMLDMGPRDALRGILREGGIGFDYCYGAQGRP